MEFERGSGPACAVPDLHSVLHREMPALRRWAWRIAAGPEAADVVQEAILRLLESGPAQVRSARAWLFRAAHTVVLDQNRRRRARQAVTQSLLWLDSAGSLRTPEDVALDACSLQRLADAVRELPPPWRDALLRVRLDGEPVPSLARHYGVSTRTVQRWVARATARCREQLEGTGGLAA